LLYDSVPEEEEAETELKASAMLAAIRQAGSRDEAAVARPARAVGAGRRILLVDHEDSFVHTLANYLRPTGAQVSTIRSPVSDADFVGLPPFPVVLLLGPGMARDFDCVGAIARARARGLWIFGVCLGLQALAEAFAGTLGQLAEPMHGK